MAPSRANSNKKTQKQTEPYYKTIIKNIQKWTKIAFIKSLILDPSYISIVSYIILSAEFVLNLYIVHRVNYTEIDWKAYMQECEGFLNGTTNYSLLKG